MNRKIWAADRFRFRIRGKNAQRFVNLVTAQGIQLAHLRWEKEGLTAQGMGRDHDKLRTFARQGGWEFTTLQRSGPGTALELLAGRPGIPVGAALFFFLLQLMGHLVWSIDFGTLQEPARNRMRQLLAECGIYEGAFLESETLSEAQTLSLQQSDLFGWISLNFTGGCLFIENTEAQTQSIRGEAAMQPLVAKTKGVIVAVEAESGFACVVPGQAVEQGELLVDVVRLDRDGKEVPQGASGKILANCEKTYTAVQPLQQEATVLSGESINRDTLYLLGKEWVEECTFTEREGLLCTEWLPLRLGRVSLPGCIRRETLWPKSSQTVFYTEQQAQALAIRNCRNQLLAEFPDARIISEQRKTQTTPDGVISTVTYCFCANIASQ